MTQQFEDGIGIDMEVAGMGVDDENLDADLRRAKLTYWRPGTRDGCSSQLPDQLCFRTDIQQVSMCHYDKGAPLVYLDPGSRHYTLVGIGHWFKGNNYIGEVRFSCEIGPGINNLYMDVFTLEDWLTTTMNQQTD